MNKKKHYKIRLIEVSEQMLSEAPAIVRKVYRGIQTNDPLITMEEKRLAIEFTDFFRLEEVQHRSFSQAFKRISNIKESISIDQRKRKKDLKRTGTVTLDGEVGPEGAAALKKWLG